MNIDFSNCEVKNALQRRFLGNKIKRVNPVIISDKTEFSQDKTVCYYGVLSNHKQTVPIIFNQLTDTGDEFTGFQGYEIELSNALDVINVDFFFSVDTLDTSNFALLDGANYFTGVKNEFENRVAVGSPAYGPTRLGDNVFQTPAIDLQSLSFKDNAQGTNAAVFMSPDGVQMTVKGYDDNILLLAVTSKSADQTDNARQVESTLALLNEYNDGSHTILDTFNQDYASGSSVVAQAMGWVASHRNGALPKKIGLYRYDGTNYTTVYELSTDDILTFGVPVLFNDKPWLLDTTVQSVTDDTSVQNLYSGGSIPANALPRIGSRLKAQFFSKVNNNALNNVVKLIFKVGTLTNYASIGFDASTGTDRVLFEYEIIRVSDTEVMVMYKSEGQNNHYQHTNNWVKQTFDFSVSHSISFDTQMTVGGDITIYQGSNVLLNP